MSKLANVKEKEAERPVSDDKNEICGIIMPIAKTDGYPEKHWGDVYSILCESAKAAGFDPNLVSFDDDAGVIHKRIVQNIYSNPIVICDISSRNANVMLELGMRLAFDKPTIIVKDDKTPYSFDIAAIEHIEYPSDLRYQSINDFKEKLQIKIIETYRRSLKDPEYTTFLKHFGTFKVAKIEEKEVSGIEFLSAEIKELKNIISTIAASKNNDVLRSNDGVRNKGWFTTKVLLNKDDLYDFDYSGLTNYLTVNGIRVKEVVVNESENSIRIVWENGTRNPNDFDMKSHIEKYIKFTKGKFQ